MHQLLHSGTEASKAAAGADEVELLSVSVLLMPRVDILLHGLELWILRRA